MKRLSGLVTLLLLVTLLGGLLYESRSQDALYELAGQRASSTEIELLKREQQSALQFMGEFWLEFFQGSYGVTSGKLEIGTLLGPASIVTFVLAVSASLLALGYALLLLMVSVRKPKWQVWLQRWNYSILGVPVFLIGICLIWVLAMKFPLFQPGGMYASSWWALPALTLGLRAGPRLYITSIEFYHRELKKHYQKTMKAMGYRSKRRFWPFTLKNMTLPVLSFWLVDFASYLAGAAVVETIFTLPGLGSLLLDALFSYDVRLILSILVTIAFFLFFVGLLQDWLQRESQKSQL